METAAPCTLQRCTTRMQYRSSGSPSGTGVRIIGLLPLCVLRARLARNWDHDCLRRHQRAPRWQSAEASAMWMPQPLPPVLALLASVMRRRGHQCRQSCKWLYPSNRTHSRPAEAQEMLRCTVRHCTRQAILRMLLVMCREVHEWLLWRLQVPVLAPPDPATLPY